MNISFIGSGNVAWHLSQELASRGHSILEIYSRRIENAQILAQEHLNAMPTDSLNFSESNAKLLILCVADDALEAVIASLQISDEVILAHTSGSKPISVFQEIKNPSGVFYPLQTFSKTKKIDFSGIPFCIEGNDQNTTKKLFSLASQLSDQVQLISSEQRKSIHIAAVFACNFSNHLLALADELLQKESIPFDILKPLIRETLDKALEFPPHTIQTGPARRKDHKVIEQHLKKLEKKANFQEIYKIMTQSIIDRYSE